MVRARVTAEVDLGVQAALSTTVKSGARASRARVRVASGAKSQREGAGGEGEEDVGRLGGFGGD